MTDQNWLTAFMNQLLRGSVGRYLVQLSTVVIGILITFAGSGLIERCSRRQELKESLHTVRNELETNRERLKASLQLLEEESAFYTLLDSFRHDIHQIPEDTFKKYHYCPFLYYNPTVRKDAMDALKSSGLIQEIGDKDFLVKLLGIYASYEDFGYIRTDYYAEKRQFVQSLTIHADTETAEIMHGGFSREAWDIYWKHDPMRNFLIAGPSRLGGILLAGRAFLEETDELIESLN